MTELDAPMVKGFAVINGLQVLRKMTTPETFDRFAWALPSATNLLLNRLPTHGEWVSLNHAKALLETAYEVAFDRDLKKCFDWGVRLQLNSLKTVHKIFVRLFSPTFLVPRAGVIWSLHYRHNGSVTASLRSETRVDLHYRGVKMPSAAYWEQLRGTAFAGLEATRVPNASTVILNGGSSSPDCDMSCEWSK